MRIQQSLSMKIELLKLLELKKRYLVFAKERRLVDSLILLPVYQIKTDQNGKSNFEPLTNWMKINKCSQNEMEKNETQFSSHSYPVNITSLGRWLLCVYLVFAMSCNLNIKYLITHLNCVSIFDILLSIRRGRRRQSFVVHSVHGTTKKNQFNFPIGHTNCQLSSHSLLFRKFFKFDRLVVNVLQCFFFPLFFRLVMLTVVVVGKTWLIKPLKHENVDKRYSDNQIKGQNTIK